MNQPPQALRVLVVEDDPINMEIVEKRLAAHGFAYASAATGAAGIALAREQQFDVALLDLRLPDMDGLEVMSTIARVRPELPVVLMTAHGSPDIEARARSLGATAYMTKPISRQLLVETLDAAIKRNPRQ